jgi:hypothetical protein
VKPPEDRPPAEELLPVFFEHWPRLRKVVQPYATKLRCPKDHLLAVVVRDPRRLGCGAQQPRPWLGRRLAGTRSPTRGPCRLGAHVTSHGAST